MANLKQMAGNTAAEYVESGMVVGLGSGSTARYAVIRIGEMLRDGLVKEIVGIPTSTQTAKLAREWDIPLTTLVEHPVIDLTIDGADEVDPELRLIKGGGGALLREKIVAHASKREIIVVDDRKIVSRLGEGFLLPVEVIPFGWTICEADLRKLGCTPRRRMVGDAPFVTDEGNYILDCEIPANADIDELDTFIERIPGVVENGFFIGYADLVVVASAEGVRLISRTT